MPPSILLFGASSLLGFHLARMFPESVLPFISPGNTAKAVRQWSALQLHDPAWVADVLKRTQPSILLYCHAVCDVPKCEVSPEWAYEMNVKQLEHVVVALSESTRLIYVSSDHVFGGDGTYPEDTVPCPISVYGRTRVEAEQLVLKRPGTLVLRAGLGIGESPGGRAGHLDWLRYRTARNLPITIIEDEYRSVVWQKDLATRVMEFAKSEETGIRHISATQVISRVDLVNFIKERFEIPATFNIETRAQQTHPHLGSVELVTRYKGDLFSPLPSVLDPLGFLSLK